MGVLTECYNAMTRKMKPAVPPVTAGDSVDALFAWNPQAVDQTLLQRGWAVEAPYKLSWWDGLVAAAAQSQAGAVLLSEDLQDGCTYGTLTVLNPSKSGIAESSARYEATSVAVRRYRSRGRPKRSAVAEVAGERGGTGRSQRTAGSDE